MMMMMMIIIIIIIFCHQLSLDRPVSALSNCLFKGLPIPLRPFGLQLNIILPSCCCSFLLHDAANLICMFLVSRQLVLISGLPKIFHSYCSQKSVYRPFFWKISSRLMPIALHPLFLRIQISLQYKWMGRASVLYTFIFSKLSGPKSVLGFWMITI